MTSGVQQGREHRVLREELLVGMLLFGLIFFVLFFLLLLLFSLGFGLGLLVLGLEEAGKGTGNMWLLGCLGLAE